MKVTDFSWPLVCLSYCLKHQRGEVESLCAGARGGLTQVSLFQLLFTPTGSEGLSG